MNSDNRLGKLRALLREQKIPLALICDPFNVGYLTGYWTILSGIAGTEQMLVVHETPRPWLAVPGLEVTLAQEQCSDLCDVRYLRPGETLVNGRQRPAQTIPNIIGQALETLPAGSAIGIDASPIRTDRYQVIAESVKGYRVVDLTPVLSSLRASKDPEEHRLIRHSAEITSKAAAAIFHSLRPGVTENDLAAEAVRAIWASGGTISHLVVASGPRGALPHALPSPRVIEPGDFVVVDVGVFYGAYWAEIARTFVAGTPTSEDADLIQLVERAQAEARRVLRPGIPAREVDQAARSLLRQAGYDDGVFIHSTGHGLGIMGPDAPVIAPHNPAPVPPNAALTLEPGLYFPGRRGIRIEDSFFVSNAGVECLTEGYDRLVS